MVIDGLLQLPVQSAIGLGDPWREGAVQSADRNGPIRLRVSKPQRGKRKLAGQRDFIHGGELGTPVSRDVSHRAKQSQNLDGVLAAQIFRAARLADHRLEVD